MQQETSSITTSTKNNTETNKYTLCTFHYKKTINYNDKFFNHNGNTTICNYSTITNIRKHF